MQVFVGDSGFVMRVNANFDMTANTELSLVFCRPDGTSITKTSADGVLLGLAALTDPDLGDLTPNEYVTYNVDPDLFVVGTAGQWAVQLCYTNVTADPDVNLYGTISYFNVAERCDT